MSITINHQTNALTATSGNITVNGSVPGPALVSGTTIKTVNGVSVLGSGDLVTGDVTLAGTQTLTNKTIDYGFNTLTGVQPTLVSGTSIKTINSASVLGSGNLVTGDVTLAGTQTLTNKTIDYASNTLTGVQPTLVSGTSIKTVNSVSILGSGDLATGDVTLAGTQTLTNKTIDYASNTLTGVQPTLVSGTSIKTVNGTSLLGSGDLTIASSGGIRNTSVASAGTHTPDSSTTDQYNITALAVTAAINTPTGTPTNGQRLTIRIEDNGSAQALSWTTTSGGYRVIGTTLPTTTVASKTVYVGCIYNSTDLFWDVVSVAQQV
jgi:hypothetical protein